MSWLRTTKIIFTASVVSLMVLSCVPGRVISEPEIIITPLGDRLTVYDGSLVYALPMTLFRVIVEFERTVEVPGPYARHAGELLGIRDIIASEKETWKILTVKVETFEEPDPSEYYVIESNSIVQSNALALKRSGLILDLNPQLYGIDHKAVQVSGGGRSELAYTDLGSDSYFISQSDTAYRLVKLDTAFIRIPYLVEKKRQLTQDQLAERAARTLLELREGKQMILTGEANVYPQSSAALDELNRMEREYLALFTGKSSSETRTVRYIVIPAKDNPKGTYEIFRFTASSGPTSAASKSGVPALIELEPAGKAKDLAFITRPVSKENEAVSKNHRLYYRPPEVATVRMRLGNEVIYESRRLIYQLGETIQLPSNYILGK